MLVIISTINEPLNASVSTLKYNLNHGGQSFSLSLSRTISISRPNAHIVYMGRK